MKVQKIINNLSQHKSEIVKLLSANNWRHFRDYFLIQEKYLSNNIDDQFEKVFCRFYILNGARGLNKPQKKKFFKLFSLEKTNLKKILELLYKIPGYQNSHKLFLSFGTKLLHTINDKLPIYDKNIAWVFELTPQSYSVSLDEKINNRIDIYEKLQERFNMLLSDTKIKNYINLYRRELQNKAESDNFFWENKFISDEKLFDSLLWALYSILK